MTSTALVLLMIPGVGFFYSGLARRKSALSLIWLSMMSVGVVSFQVRCADLPNHALVMGGGVLVA
jgi:ammonia channel protein AmtB